MPTVPPGNEEVVMAGATGCDTISMLSALVSLPEALVAFTVKLAVSTVVGVPLITPVSLSSERPAGKLPLSMLQVIGVSPVAARVWL